MARIRSVHPGLFTDEAFVSVSELARLLFIGLWTEADDQGVFEWKPVTIKMRLLPVDNADVAALLRELEEAGMVRRYGVDARHYGAVRNFGKYQRPKKPKFIHPMPDEFRTYVASSSASSELDDDEGSVGSEPKPPQPPPVPKKAEKSPQMEDGGGKRERKDGDDSSSLAASPARKRARPAKSAITPDAQPNDEQRRVAADAGLSDDEFRRQWASFRDHHLSKGNVFVDWTAAWRQWVRRRDEFAPSSARSAPRRSTAGFADSLLKDLEHHERAHDATHEHGSWPPDTRHGNPHRDLSLEARAGGATVLDAAVVGTESD